MKDELCGLSEGWSDKGLHIISHPEAEDVPSFATKIDAHVDPSGSMRETQERLNALCKEQGHLVATVIDNVKHEARHVCHRCGDTEIRTLSIVK